MTFQPDPDDIGPALEALGPGALRAVVRAALLELDGRPYRRVVDLVMESAVRAGTGWAPPPLGQRAVADALAFVKAAMDDGDADPSDADRFLGLGSTAFLRGDYPAAHRIFAALLPPIGNGEIHLGQHELVDEVLDVDPWQCAAQYLVATYMASDPAKRAAAVRSAIDQICGVATFSEPIEAMERAAVEPLPELDHFLKRWRNLVAREARRLRRDPWETDVHRWHREAVWRIEGAEGLATLARSTGRASDLRAWCRSLVQAGDWTAALAAFEEAASLVPADSFERGGFLDGAALAAQELRHGDLSLWLENAWRAAPDMLRLRRWLGSARNKSAIRARAAEALDACPESAQRQRAFLHVVLGDFTSAAKLLAEAPGLGWSGGEHPGHLIFPLFRGFLCERGEAAAAAPAHETVDSDLLDAHQGGDGPSLVTPEVDEILRRAGVTHIGSARARRASLAAMREAAEKRLAGVVENKRRNYYGHAASLVAARLACDASPEAVDWLASLRAQYRRYPALRSQLDHSVGAL
jgi:hypothetical protein